jgi:haloalkane dehalogenase
MLGNLGDYERRVKNNLTHRTIGVLGIDPYDMGSPDSTDQLMKKLIWIALLLGFLSGCASVQNTQAAFDQHVTQFNAAQPHQPHRLLRKDGFAISAREFGAANRGKGASLVLMHGFPDNQHLYDLLIPKLAGQYHVVSFDFLGWGESDKPPQHKYDIASQRADLDTVIEQLKLSSVAIVVHDLSGQSGIDWALDNAAQTAALVLLNTYYLPMPTLVAPDAIQFYSTPGLLRDLAVWGAGKSASRFQSGVANQIGLFMSNPESRATFVPVISHSAPSIRPAFFSSTAVLWQELDARATKLPAMQQFNKPVYVIFGADDPFLNKGVATEFKRIFPNSSLHLVEKAGHYVQLDNAGAVSSILLEKLAKLR